MPYKSTLYKVLPVIFCTFVSFKGKLYAFRKPNILFAQFFSNPNFFISSFASLTGSQGS